MPCLDAMRQVLLQKASLTVRNYKDGRTALHTAAIYGKKAAVELLIENRAPLSMKTTSGRTALALARKERFKPVEMALRRHERRLLSEEEQTPDTDGATADFMEEAVSSSLLITVAAFIIPYVLFVMLRNARKRRSPSGSGASSQRRI